MRTTFLCLSLLAVGLNTQGQLTVQKYFKATGTATLSITELSTGNLFTGIAYQSGVSLMDPQGDILSTRCYGLLPFTAMQSVRRHTDNEFYFVGGLLSDSCEVEESLEVNPLFGKMDSLGSILFLNHYQLNAVTCSNTASDLVVTGDGGAVVWGRYNSFFALRLDQTGLPLWSKQFNHSGSISFIREFPNSDLLVGFNMDTAGVGLARLNAVGDILWCKSYIRPKGNLQDCVIESDSSFIVTGYTDSIGSLNGFIPLPVDYEPKLFMMKVDGNGQIQWCKGYVGEPRWYARSGVRMTRTLDGKYVILANIGFTNNNIAYRPFMMKTNQNGDTLWTRSAGASGYTYNTINLVASADGGFYYDGSAYGDFGQWSGAAFLFKTDSLGHLPCHERTHPIEVMDLFPTDSSFTLNFIEGAVASATTNSEVTYDPIVTFDGCTFATGLPPISRSPRKMSIRPNPNTGRFNLDFKDPLIAESWYSVYDTMGKLLFQRPLGKGKETEEIDLSRYGKGTYLIKCTDPTGVYHERVVVE